MGADIDAEDLVQVALDAEQGDLAVAIRDVEQAVSENYPDQDAMDQAMDEVILPFNDVEREVAFTIGITFGAFLEQEYPDDTAGEDDE